MIMYNAKIPVEDYARKAAIFSPQKFDADAWVQLAKEAGQKYIIITAKHHDGFALFRSKASPYNIYDYTPFKRDVLQELAKACKKYGVKLGFYYSQAQDWHHAGGAAYKNTFNGADPSEGHWDKAQDGDFDQYMEKVAIPQVRELLSNYGPVAVFWWDTPVGMNSARAKKLDKLLKLQPNIITNNRLNSKFENVFLGDTETPEQTIPPTGFKDRDFEVCMTMNDTWGFKKYDENWKPAGDLIRKLVDVASKGGNFLLNVGPDGLGQIPQPSIERLKAVGSWTRANSEAIYGTAASPFAKLPWGRCTQKPGILYLHVFNWPANGQLRVPGLKSAIRSARLLTNNINLTVESVGDDKLIRLPANAPDSVVSVIRVELDGSLNVDNKIPSPSKNGAISLPLWMTDIHNNGYGTEARLGEDNGVPAIVGWTDPKSHLAWGFETTAAGRFEIVADISVSKSGTNLKLKIGKESATAILTPGSQSVVLGTISIPAAGIQELAIYPVAKGWEPVILRAVTLRPAASNTNLKIE